MTPKALLGVIFTLSVAFEHFANGQASSCDSLFPSGLPGRVFQVLSGKDLKNSINRARNSDVLQLNVINGTHWLHLGGELTSFEAVLGQPPSTSSDLNLESALEQLNETSVKTMVKFHPRSLSIASNLDKFAKSFPIWRVSSPQEKANFDLAASNLLLALEWPQKTYGLDEVFTRVYSENLLLEFDFYRIKAILEQIFAQHSVADNDLVYLSRKYKSIKRESPTSFTELFLNNLAHLADHLKDMDEDLVFLPDLQKTSTTCSKQELDDVKDSIIRADKCTLLMVRAGIFMKPDCLAGLSSFQAQNSQSVKFIVYSLPTDFLPLNEFVTALNSFGKENVILDLPKVVLEKIQNLSGNSAFDELLDISDGPIASHQDSLQTCHIFVRLFSLALFMYDVINM